MPRCAATDITSADCSAPPVKRLPRLAPSAASRPREPVRSTALRSNSAALEGRLQTMTCPVSFSNQRKAGTSWLLPCRIASWLAPVWLLQSVRQAVSRWVLPSQPASVGIAGRLPARADASTSWPTPSSCRKTVPGAVGSGGSPACRLRRPASLASRRP